MSCSKCKNWSCPGTTACPNGTRPVTLEIKVKYSSLDRFSKTATFKTLKGAQKFAQKWVGIAPEISGTFQYAVSADGIGKITVEGCRIKELFPAISPWDEE